MRTFLSGSIGFFGTWAFAHLFYAFTELDWALFTEWTSTSRGMVLLMSLLIGAWAAIMSRLLP
jgi:hypothetical protein